jgi:thiol-disulfide isomerase/thioredoxin
VIVKLAMLTAEQRSALNPHSGDLMRALWTLVTLALFLIAVFGVSTWLDHEEMTPRRSSTNSTAKAFLASETMTSSHQNFAFNPETKIPILLHFWATWCSPCVAELPELIKRTEEFRKFGFLVVAVAEDESWAALDIFFKRHPNLVELRSEMTLILDKDRSLSGLYGIHQFPETYIIDKNFAIRAVFVGAQNWLHPEMMAFLKKVAQP